MWVAYDPVANRLTEPPKSPRARHTILADDICVPLPPSFEYLSGTKAYDLNPVRMLFDDVTDLIEEHSRDELESQLTELKEEWAAEYDVSSLDEFREQFVADEFSPAELRERRNVIATREAVNTELGLVKHALQLYGDVVELSSPRTQLNQLQAPAKTAARRRSTE